MVIEWKLLLWRVGFYLCAAFEWACAGEPGTQLSSHVTPGDEGPTDCVPSEVKVKQVSGGRWFTCSVLSTGGLRCWGYNTDGQLGDGTYLNMTNAPPTADVLSDVASVATGENHACAVLASGGLRCWGNNWDYQLGDGTLVDRYSPPDFDILTDVVAAAAGGASCALLSSGGVRCWGTGDLGRLGYGGEGDQRSPPPMDVISGAKGVAVGGSHACALLASGGVRCWGSNLHGQLGQGTIGSQGANASPAPSSDALGGVVAIATGSDHTCAVLETGGVRCWGRNFDGELGDGGSTDVGTPPSTDVLTNAVGIAAGALHTCALLATGGVRCWGENGSGQLGDGTFVSRRLPGDTDVITGAVAIAAGWLHTCVVLNTGALYCWGDNRRGQLGDGTNDNRPVPVAVAFPANSSCP